MARTPAGRFMPIKDMEFENLEDGDDFIDMVEAQTEYALDESTIHWESEEGEN